MLAAWNCSDASLPVLVGCLAEPPSNVISIFRGKDAEFMNYLPRNPKMEHARNKYSQPRARLTMLRILKILA